MMGNFPSFFFPFIFQIQYYNHILIFIVFLLFVVKSAEILLKTMFMGMKLFPGHK